MCLVDFITYENITKLLFFLAENSAKEYELTDFY